MTRDGADISRQIRALEERGARTNVEPWTLSEAQAFFAPDWVSVGPDGAVSTVESVFMSFQEGRSQPWAQRFDLLSLDIRPGCETTIVIGLAEAARPQAPATEAPTRFRFLNVWRRIDGEWRYAATQFTRFRAPAKP